MSRAEAALFRKGNIMSETTIQLVLILLIVWILKEINRPTGIGSGYWVEKSISTKI